jgi:hypothetical protein
MKILSFINVSNHAKIECDSGFIFQRLVSHSLTETGCQVALAGPSIAKVPQAEHYDLDFGGNKYAARFHFDWLDVARIIKQANADIILVNQTELASNIRALLVSENLKIPIVTYCHYIPYWVKNDIIISDPSLDDGGLGHTIRTSFVNGVRASDFIVVHSAYAKNLIITGLRSAGFDYHGLLDRVHIIPPPSDPFLVDLSVSTHREPRVIYNHRLYAHYGADFAVSVIGELVNRTSIHAIVMDIHGERSLQQQNLDSTVELTRRKFRGLQRVEIRQDGHNRETYREILRSSRAALAPMREGCVWSMSVIDCIGMGVPVVAPRLAFFPEVIPFDLTFNSAEEAVYLIERLLKDDRFYFEKIEECKSILPSIAPEVFAAKFLRMFT